MNTQTITLKLSTPLLLAATLLLAITLASCGQKGPLYLDEHLEEVVISSEPSEPSQVEDSDSQTDLNKDQKQADKLDVNQ